MDLRVVRLDSTTSTQHDVARAASAGEAEGYVVVAGEQTEGRGRLDRSWTTEPGRGVAISILLRPRRAPNEWSWLPLLVGHAVAAALSELGVQARVKWPNDVLVDGRKVAGILAETAGSVADGSAHADGRQETAVIIGIGINVQPPGRLAEPPLVEPIGLREVVPDSSQGDEALAEAVLAHVLGHVQRIYERWSGASSTAAEALHDEVRRGCATLGQQVRVRLPDGEAIEGEAVDLSPAGELLVRLRGGDGEVRTVSAGDVVHLR